ncbi:hypothetical protein Pan189_20760 [Stratiformator vulcanicus]|uniref:Uncharacterized protein n=1 Tax=Stratiformator vulcanicus TaxID=2527980 RepID=A0A517R1G4_9PLAN|nr:hypothetical protein Pan189_20760 [Stratiformator vulcanicus]
MRRGGCIFVIMFTVLVAVAVPVLTEVEMWPVCVVVRLTDRRRPVRVRQRQPGQDDAYSGKKVGEFCEQDDFHEMSLQRE